MSSCILILGDTHDVWRGVGLVIPSCVEFLDTFGGLSWCLGQVMSS